MIRSSFSSAYELLRDARTVVITQPTDEPISLAEALDHLRNPDAVHNANIERLIVAARQRAELDTGRALVTQTQDVYFDGLPCGDALLLPLGRLQSVTSVKYYDTANVEATFSSTNYLVDTSSEPSRIVLNSGSSWPSSLRCANAVIVRGVFGYGASSAVPQGLKQAMLSLIGANFEHREDVIIAQFAGQFLQLPGGYADQIAPYKLMTV